MTAEGSEVWELLRTPLRWSLPHCCAPHCRNRGEHSLPAGPLTMHFIMRLDVACIKQAEAIKLSKICNSAATLIRPDSTFVGSIEALVNCVCVLDLEYGVKFLDAHKKRFLRLYAFVRVSAIRAQVACVRYAPFVKLLPKNNEILPALEMFSTEGRAWKSLGTSRFDCPVLHSSEPDKVCIFDGWCH